MHFIKPVSGHNLSTQVLALIMVFVATASAAGVCSPDQVNACRLQQATLAKWAATSTDDLCNLCDLCVDVEKRIDLEECSTFCSVGKEECKATLAGGRDLCPKCGVPTGPAPIRYTLLG